MTTVKPAITIHVTHTGLYADGRANANPVLLPDLEVGYEYQTRKVPVYVPHGGSIDIPLTSKALLSYEQGAIRKFVSVGVLTATLFVEPETYSNALRPLATAYPAGTMIWNTDDNAPNYSDGTAWRDAVGSLT